jgi:hypothetical protein
MTPSPSTRSPWLSALLALFMVLVLPACWYGALARAQSLGIAAPSSSNNNEERDEHEEREIEVADAAGQRPPVPRPEPEPAERRHVVAPALAPTRLASVAPPVHPSRFSERRLR